MIKWLLERFAKTKKENRAKELNQNADKWDSGELGESEKHAKISTRNKTEEERILAETDHPGLKHQKGRSMKNLLMCHPDIQLIAKATLMEFDAIVIEGWRDKATQEAYVKKGVSWVSFPGSYHNSQVRHIKPEFRPKGKSNGSPCSLAMDIIPYPVDWNDTKRFEELAKVIKKNAKRFDIHLDHGYDLWKKDRPHWQLTLHRDEKQFG